MIIKPTKYKLSLIYECPVCHTEYPFDSSELHKNQKWYCGCGQEFSIEKVYGTTLGISYSDGKLIDSVIKTNGPLINEATKYVAAMGYNRTLINNVVNRIDLTGLEQKSDIAKAILKEIDLIGV